MSQKKKQSNVKLVEEVSRKRMELIVYAAFMVGFIARAEMRAVDNPDNYQEIQNLIKLISKIEGLRKDESPITDTGINAPADRYNQVLDDLLASLNKHE